MKGNNQALLDSEYLARRRMELNKNLRPFQEMLLYIYSKMPPTGYILNGDGEMQSLPISKEWQARIDAVHVMKDACIKSHFPEFYEH